MKLIGKALIICNTSSFFKNPKKLISLIEINPYFLTVIFQNIQINEN